MILDPQRVPIVINNIRANRGWRVQDMMNWHRMVKPLRSLTVPEEPSWDLFQLAVDLCSRFSVQYEPNVSAPLPPPRRTTASLTDEPRVAVLVDAADHLSGVAVSIAAWATEARRRGLTLTIHSSGRQTIPDAVSFDPIGTLRLHNYAGLQLPVPRVADVMAYMQASNFSCIHVSTPGPVGMLGLLAARSLNIPVYGTYHTDFPRYAATLTGDPSAESSTWRFMQWFYGQLDRIAAPSIGTRQDLMAHGFDGSKIDVVGRGVNTDRFSPVHRCESWRRERFPDRQHLLLYVGRVSKEKGLDCLAEAFTAIAALRQDVGLVIVGDGPYLETMRDQLAGLPVVFTGQQTGDDLLRAYASCDCFVFPSETDTFGVVLLEAQASGIPALVSSKGGPQHAISDGQTGLVVSPMTPATLSAAIESVLADPNRLATMRRAARSYALRQSNAKAFDEFWSLHRGSGATPMRPPEDEALSHRSER